MPELSSSRSWTAEAFLALPREEKRKRIERLSDAEAEALIYDWEFWARDNQLLPPGDWQTWLVMAGRGFGKTRVGAETVRSWIQQGFDLVNLIAPTSDDARDVMIEGESGILAVCPRNERPEYLPSKRRLVWPNGAKSLIFTADEPERLRGKQHKKLWCDELAAWRYPDAWDQASFGLRLGQNPQAVVTTTPKPSKLVKAIAGDPNTFITRGTTYENRANLAEKFYSQIITKYEGTRLGRQELNAELLTDNPGALWTLANIDETRIKASEMPDLDRIVVGVDPAVTSNENSDETGIIAVGRSKARPPHFYVLEDASDVMTPNGWATATVKVYRDRKADRIVGETNNGGDLVEVNIRTVDKYVAYKSVHASRGKYTRAEPVAALYEQKRVHHVGTFAQLEDQMCDFNPAVDSTSPDRMDALVWAIWELSEGAGVFAVIEHGKEAQAEMDKVKTSKLIKPETNEQTEACPKCESKAIARLGGQKRCSQCGHQFGKSPEVQKQTNRKELAQ